MTTSPETENPDYEYQNHTTSLTTAPPVCNTLCIFLGAAYLILIVLGLAENGLVIWTAGFKVKKSVNTTWSLGLAVSDFIFCLSLPLDVVSGVADEWDFVPKISSFITSFNMFSSIFLLVIISVDRCVVITFPVWAKGQRTGRKASAIVLLAYIFSAVLSTPLAFFQDVQPDERTAEVVYSFIFGFVIPFLVIIICYVVIMRKLRESNRVLKFKKSFKILMPLTATILICWLPLHVLALMDLNNETNEDVLQTEDVFVVILAGVESLLTPLIYVFMRKDFRKHIKVCSVLELRA
ncbi:chemerin-like receptor 1 [Salminus brasiliensis]|uniref:chemerin-like receptor 1 n=1 Tax=Salminus brasiliensis TaxID=930266 RepID=UPI003B831C6D